MRYLKQITISFLFVLTACQSDIEISPVADSNSPSSNVVQPTVSISPEDAIQQALAFVNGMESSTRSNESDKRVSSVYAWRSTDIYSDDIVRGVTTTTLPDTLLYIVNFEENSGYALVSASNKVPGVMAYIENGSLTPNDEIDNPGFQLFLEGYREYVLSDREFVPTDSIVGPSGPYQPVPGHFYEVEYSAGPLLTTNWGQREPYNNNCPIINNQHALAGCVAIAIAQITGYHRYPSQPVNYGTPYNWNSIMQYDQVPTTDSVACANVAMLVHDVGLLVNMNYGQNSSGAYFYNVADAWSDYDYHYQKKYSADFDSIMVDISNERPVFMVGERETSQGNKGHAWVVDGVAIKSLYLERGHGGGSTIIKLTQNLIHCNWGWYGDKNGYFIIGAFQNRYNLDNDGIESGFKAYNINNYVYRKIYPNIP